MATLEKEGGFYAVVFETKHRQLVCQRAMLQITAFMKLNFFSDIAGTCLVLRLM